MSRKDDPKKGKFRSWTKDEQTRIMDAHFDDDPVVCPVDGSEVTVTESPGKTSNRVVASCMRCGAHCQA